MLAILIAWIIISFIFLSFGDLLILLYNKVCKTDERYSLIDTFWLGLCFVMIPLSISSYWLPSDHYIMAAYCIFGIIYWSVNRKRLLSYTKFIRKWIGSLSTAQLVIILLISICIIFHITWHAFLFNHHFDSSFYHQGAVHWNEAYPAVKGLANLEERFGFNSAYTLIASIFTFRFLWGGAIYPLQSLVVLYFVIWTLLEVYKSNFEIKRCILLLLCLAFVFLNNSYLILTTTDLVPNTIIAYLIANAILNPQQIKSKYLLFAIVPVCLITFKLYCIFTVLVTLFILKDWFCQKKFKPIFFICTISLLIISTWCIRNVILSGYLVYPLYQLDLFDVDWKVPLEIARTEQEYIHSYAWHGHQQWVLDHFLHFKAGVCESWQFIIHLLLPIVISTVVYKLIKQRKAISKIHKFIALILFINIIYFLIESPAFRFASGHVFGLFFFCFYLLFDTSSRLRNVKLYDLQIGIKNNGRKLASYIIPTTLLIIFSAIVAFNMYGKMGGLRRLMREEYQLKSISASLFFLYRPGLIDDELNSPLKKERYNTLSSSEKQEIKDLNYYQVEFSPYKLNNAIIIYVTNDPNGFTYDKIPAVPDYLAAKNVFQDYRNLEARGKSIQDGFRSKLNKN